MSEKVLLKPGYNIIEDPAFKHVVEALNESASLISDHIHRAIKNKGKQLRGNTSYKGFMGGHPVSMNKQNLQPIKQDPGNYLICEKTDGVRYMMISLNNGMSFLMGRSKTNRDTNNFFLTKFENFPKNFYQKSNLTNFTKELLHITNIFDGEMVRDEIRGKNFYMYLLFDTIQCGVNGFVPTQPYEHRLQMAQKYLETLKTLKKFDEGYFKAQKGGENSEGTNTDSESFLDSVLKPFPEVKIHFKDFYRTSQIGFLLKNVIGNKGLLPHGNDGLIFTQNANAPYVNGVNRKIVKWKPPHMNTIDFAILPNIEFKGIYEKRILDLYVSFFPRGEDETKNVLFDFMFVSEEEFQKVLERIEEKEDFIIAECKYDNEFSDELIPQFLAEYYNFNDEDIKKLIGLAIDDDAQDMADNENAIHILNQSITHRYKRQGKGNWVIDRHRDDKDHPNMLRTASSIWESIMDNLTGDELVKALAPKPPPGVLPIVEKKKWKRVKQV